MRVTKKKVFVLALIVICLSCLAYGTLAFFTDEARTRNVITTGAVDIDLKEYADEAQKEPYPTEPVKVMPSAEVTKVVVVENGDTETSNDAWIRVQVKKTITLAKGQDGQPDLSLIDIHFNTDDWFYLDGFWYYTKPLGTDETTSPLFDKVTFAPRMGNMYKNSTADIDVVAYAVQEKHNGGMKELTPENVGDVAGWPKVTEP